MDTRENDLLELKTYTEGIDKELSMILQSLQWDQNHLIEGTTKATCKYDKNHRIPSDTREEHENRCFYKQQGYSSDDTMFPDPMDINSNTIVKLNHEDICRIIDTASKSDPTFKKVSVICMAMNSYILFITNRIVSLTQGIGSCGPEPSSLARLQAAYTADERRAIHDAVVSAVPACHDLADLALLSSNGEQQKSDKSKSRVEILAELRDMRRRRTKYRVAAKTRNYSDVLRDVIKTQMEFYSDVHVDASIATNNENRKINNEAENNKHTDNEQSNAKQIYKTVYDKHDRYKIYPRDSLKDRDSRWSSEHKNEGTSGRDRYVGRSRGKRYDNIKEAKSKYEARDEGFRGSYKYKHDSSSNRTDRDRYKDRSGDRRYDNRAESIKREDIESYSRSPKHKDEGTSRRPDKASEMSKESKNVNRDSIARESGNKYDKYKSRDSKRRHGERSNSYYRENKSDQSQRDEKYRRYYDV